MGQKVSINIIKTDSKIQPGSLPLGDSGSSIQIGNDKDDEEEEEEEEDDDKKECPCECCNSKCPCCVKLTFCFLAALA